MEAGMNEQALLVSALRGSKEASEATIEIERRRLARWEAALFADFRREMRDKFRRQSQKATSLRDRLGLSMKAPTSGALDRSLPNALGPATGHRHSVRHSDPGGNDASLTARRQSDTSGFARGLVRGGGHQRANSFDASGSSELLPPILAASREVSVEEDLDGWREWSEEGSRAGSNSTGGSRGSVRWRSDDSPARPGGQRGRNEAADWEEAQAAAGAEASAPGVNIYLDVKIIIESGALHLSTLPKGPQEEETTPKAKLAKSKSRSKVGQPAAVTKTVIAMPSLSLRSYYTSQAAQGTLNPSIVKEARLGEGVAEALGRSSKRAQFYLYTALESMPEETLITPHIMQFFEDTLEPLGTASAGGWQSEGEASGRLSSLGWGEMSDTNDPDTATDDQDEGDAPAPSVLVGPASSVNVEVILYFLVQSSTLRFTTTANPSVTGVECLLRLPSLHLAFTRRDAPDEPDEALGGGIHCSASFKDFSLAIFHPYGGMGEGTRKDYLTLTVDAIAFNFSRSRNLLTPAGAQTMSELENQVKFSVIVDIGKAYFNYDMRRLKDILSFPKAWYRKAIAKRFFLGDQSGVSADTSGLSKDSGAARDVPTPSSRRATPRPGTSATTLHAVSPTSTPGSRGQGGGSGWEALGLLQFHFAELRIDAEMGGTMGQTSWTTKDLNTRGRVGLRSRGSQSLEGELTMGSSELHASRGIISGRLELHKLRLNLHATRTHDQPPHHSLYLTLGKAEVQVDWMSGQILIAHATDAAVRLSDEWRSQRDHSGEVLESRVELMGETRWSELGIIITRKTVKDFVRIHLKLLEFFEQQVKRTRQILTIPSASAIRISLPTADQSSQSDVKYRHHHHWQKVLGLMTEIQLVETFFPLPKQRTVLSGHMALEGAELSLSCIHGAGKGNFQMMGQGQWALFHLIQPSVSFDASAMYVAATDEDGDPTTETLVHQKLKVELGTSSLPGSPTRERQTRAVVARVQQGRRQAPRMGAPVQEWMDYAHRGVIAAVLGGQVPKGVKASDHSVSVLFKLPGLELSLDTTQQQPEDEPAVPSTTVRFRFRADFRDHLYISSNVESIYFLHDLVSAYMQEKGPAGKSGTEEEAETGSKDARSYESLAWRLEPSIRFLESQSTDIIGVEFVLKKLGFDHAQTTIPKWIQRGAMDPLDAVLAHLLHRLLLIVPRPNTL